MSDSRLQAISGPLTLAAGFIIAGLTFMFLSTDAYHQAFTVGALCAAAGLIIAVAAGLWFSNAGSSDRKRSALRRRARAIVIGLIDEGKTLHNVPGYAEGCTTHAVALATPYATAPFTTRLEADWRIRFQNKLNAKPFKPGTGTALLKDTGNRLDPALTKLENMLDHLDEYIDFDGA